MDSARAKRSLRSRPIPSRRHSSLGRAAKVRLEARTATEGPEDLCPDPQVRPTSKQPSHFGISRHTCLSLLLPFFPNPLFSALPSVFFGSLTACTTFRCVNFAEVHEDREVCSLVVCLYLHLFVVQLETTMLSNPAVCDISRCYKESTAVSCVPNLAPHWNQDWRRNPQRLSSCFF